MEEVDDIMEETIKSIKDKITVMPRMTWTIEAILLSDKRKKTNSEKLYKNFISKKKILKLNDWYLLALNLFI